MWFAVMGAKALGPERLEAQHGSLVVLWAARLKEADRLVGTACRRAAGLGSLRPGKPWECGRHGPRTRIPQSQQATPACSEAQLQQMQVCVLTDWDLVERQSSHQMPAHRLGSAPWVHACAVQALVQARPGVVKRTSPENCGLCDWFWRAPLQVDGGGRSHGCCSRYPRRAAAGGVPVLRLGIPWECGSACDRSVTRAWCQPPVSARSVFR